MSRRNAERWIEKFAKLWGIPKEKYGRVFVLDVERMMHFSITEAADEINDLYKLWEKSW